MAKKSLKRNPIRAAGTVPTNTQYVMRVDAMNVKGATLKTKNSFRLVPNLARLMVPVMFTIVRRASTMMAVLEMRGSSFSEKPKRLMPYHFGVLDAAILAVGMLIIGLAIAARLDLLRFLA